ncbi:MAG: hypothetical protein RLZ85_130 [Verrucomicrobiota bacterium]|jgi:hypothetical protein
MMHDFLYQDYEFQDYPSAQPLPAMRTRRGAIQEQQWLTWQGHPIAEAIRTLETEYVKYPGVRGGLGTLQRLLFVAYGAHPLFGARATHRLAGMIRVAQGADEEFAAMTLAADTFAQYPFTLGLAAECADHAADCAQLVPKAIAITQAWRQRAQELRSHAASER